MRNILLITVVATAALFTSSVQASTNIFNFDSDPSGILTVYRSGDNGTLTEMAGAWKSANGSPLEPGVGDQSTNGFFAITQTTPNPPFTSHGMKSVIVFNNFDAGLVVAGFTFTCDVRIGAGSASPADGFSLSYARANDPVITQTNGNGFASSPTGEGNLPEEGTQTGLAICFDAWFSGGSDVIGLTLRVDNNIITNVPMPTLNGACADATSLQTGPAGGDVTALCWQPLAVELTTSGLLNVSYKGITFLTNFPAPFAPGPGRLIFAGRTGGSWQEQDVDNIRIVTIPAAKPVIALLPADRNANGFRYTITDSGGAEPDTNTITLQLDGSPVTPTAITRNPPVTLVTYRNTSLVMASGSSHTASIQFTGPGFTGADTSTNTFTVPPYTLLTGADVAPTAVNTSLSGFAGRIHQLPIARYPDAGNLIGIERQLADLFIDPNTGQPYASTTVNGVSTFTEDGVVNWSQDVPLGGNETGYFQFDAAPPADWPDAAIPGVDANQNPSTDYLAAEMVFELDLSPGSYQFGVLSDNGFRLSAGAEPRHVFNAKVLSSHEGFNTEVLANVVVTNAGKYPIRLIWGENDGGAQLEFYLVDSETGQRVLINNRTNPANVAAYRDTTALTQPYVRWVGPAPGETGVNPGSGVMVKFMDGSAWSIVDGSISLKLNGSGAPTISNAGGETTATLVNSSPLPSGSTNVVALSYSTSSGGSFTHTWQFVAAGYELLPLSLRTPPGSGSDPGFRIRTWQLSTNHMVNSWAYSLSNLQTATDNYEAGMLFSGLWGPNQADTTAFTHNGEYFEDGTINYRATQGGLIQDPLVGENDIGSFTSANSHPDFPVPGITASQAYPNGGAENCALIANAFVEFPATGFYQMGVLSDDGFEVTVGDSEQEAGTLQILAPGPIARAYAFFPNVSYLPELLSPVARRVILTDPKSAQSTLLNSNAIAGNIAFFSRNEVTNYATGYGGSAARVERCFQAGAVAVIEYVAPGQFVFNINTTNVTGPFAMLSHGDGTNLLAYVTQGANSPVIASFGGGDRVQRLGVFNGGRGAGATIFGLYVPQAGLYPMRLLWQNGGGDASLEWWTQDAEGMRHLINDSTDALALKAYRARTVTGGAPRLNPPVLTGGNAISLSWTGVGELQQAGSPTGPYLRTPSQANPQSVGVGTESKRFFRVRQY